MSGAELDPIGDIARRVTMLDAALAASEQRNRELTRQVGQLQARVDAAEKDTARLDAIAAEYWKLDPFEMPTGAGDADVGWRIVQYHQGKPEERTVAEVYTDDPRRAIDAALTAPPSSAPTDPGGDVNKWHTIEEAPPNMTVVFVKLERRRGEYAGFHHPTKGWFISDLKHKDRGLHVTHWRDIRDFNHDHPHSRRR